MAKYMCEGFKAISTDDARVQFDGMKDAAKLFAEREARRQFGKRGYCRTIRLDNWSENGERATYEAFIGYPVRGQNATCGRNEWLYVRRAA